MTQQAFKPKKTIKVPSPPVFILICIVGAIALFALVFAVDRYILGNKIFPAPKTYQFENEDCEPKPCAVKKPIVYLYPEKTTEVSVKLGSPEKLTTVYPEYDNGWRVLAEPDGKLTDLSTGRKLYALYWEGKNDTYKQTGDGFVVKGPEVASFLEEKLEILGLNYKEAEEFIVYWLPKLEKNSYNYIRFATQAEIEADMPLSVTPKPDTTIRVMMLWRSLDEPIEVTEQQLETPARNGFTVVEWGGSEL